MINLTEIFSCYGHSLLQANDPTSENSSPWPFQSVMSELGHRDSKFVSTTVLSWLVGPDVNYLLDPFLKQVSLPVKNFHFLEVNVMYRKFNMDMLGYFQWGRAWTFVFKESGFKRKFSLLAPLTFNAKLNLHLGYHSTFNNDRGRYRWYKLSNSDDPVVMSLTAKVKD